LTVSDLTFLTLGVIEICGLPQRYSSFQKLCMCAFLRPSVYVLCVCLAKFGTPNQRIETLFSFVPEIRSLGMLHYKMTKTLSLQAEDVMKSS